MVLYGLTPLAAELLTLRLEQQVDTTPPGEQETVDADECFYRTFYGAFGDDPDEALRALAGRELLGQERSLHCERLMLIQRQDE